MTDTFFYRNRYLIFALALILVHACNLFIDIMEVDAAQYASISMEMGFNQSYLEVFHRGRDYLDKPPLLFWLSSLSMQLFGISNFAYKLPALLVLILGIYSTFRFALLWYSRKIAVFAALIVASTQAFFLMSNDVRTDTMLTGLIIFSIWQLSAYLKKPSLLGLMLSALGIGCAMLAKGPIGLIIPAIAFTADFCLKRQWKNFFRPQWLLLKLLVAIVLFPMSYGLYTQFDLHPEKTAYGIESPSGLRFFYWTQSFGRITGESSWDNGAPFSFFFTSILWDFQPWIFFLIPALIVKLRQLFRQRFRASENQEFISMGAFVLVFLMLSKSNYKLPHYIFPLFPFAAILVADYLHQLSDKALRRFARFQFGFMHIFIAIVVLLFIGIFPPENLWLPTLLLLLFCLIWFVFLKIHSSVDRVLLPSLGLIVIFNLTAALHFYPNLLKYQGSSQAGKDVHAMKIDNSLFHFYKRHGHALDFYAKQLSNKILWDSIPGLPSGSYVFCDQAGYDAITEEYPEMKIAREYDHYHVTSLTIPFLNKNSRPDKLQKRYLLRKD